jgi:hypothetical protein
MKVGFLKEVPLHKVALQTGLLLPNYAFDVQYRFLSKKSVDLG